MILNRWTKALAGVLLSLLVLSTTAIAQERAVFKLIKQ